MCDYSLYEFPNRLARDGEELVTYRFPLGCLGLASPAELENAQPKPWGKRLWTVPDNRPSGRSSVCAICIPPGAHLLLKDISAEMQRDLRLGPEECGKFIETSLDAYRYRDAIQFANGRVIPLRHLREGQRVKILTLDPVEEFVAHSQTVSALKYYSSLRNA